jgi:iron complex outermembrane receptor protein
LESRSLVGQPARDSLWSDLCRSIAGWRDLLRPTKSASTAITDLEINYNYLESWTVTFGANNLFDQRPEAIGVVPGDPTTLQDGSNIVGAPLSISPYGINGGFYYTRLTFKF